jgi:hypothetical protein
MRAAAVQRRDERRVGSSVAHVLRAAVIAAEAVISAVVCVGPSSLTDDRALVTGTCVPSGKASRCRVRAEHERLVYELLDAHADTAYLAAELASEPRWAAHLDYLRALQRKGRQTLAQMSVENET